MEEWVREIFASGHFRPAMLPAAVLLGIITAMGSCCNYAIWAAAAGFAASREPSHWARNALLPLSFVAGAMLFMAVLGAGIGAVGEVFGAGFRFWGMLAAGSTSILFGLVSLNLISIRIPVSVPWKGRVPGGLMGAAVFGAVVGGTSMACSICCGAGLPVVLAMAASSGQSGWGAGILSMFALGFGLPFAVAMYGVSLGRSMSWARSIGPAVSKAAGGLLLAAGFWMLYSLV